MRNYFDLPPAWLLGGLLLAWLQKTYLPAGLAFGPVWADLVGGLLVGGGAVLAALAVMEFRTHRTTIIPHREPARLITTGIYTRSRNPIYLADVMILAGFILFWDAVLALPLVPALLWVLEKRFVEPEEARLAARFGPEWEAWAERTRRWL